MSRATDLGDAIVTAIQAVVKPSPPDGGTTFLRAYWEAIAAKFIDTGFIPPTVQVFSTAGTFVNGYTTPAGVKYIKVKVLAAGGGGVGSGTGAGTLATDGGDSSFGSVITAPGGKRAIFQGNPAAGGLIPTISSPAIQVIAVPGGQGQSFSFQSAITTAVPVGGQGGSSYFGGAGGGGPATTGVGGNAAANSGSGGGGGGANNVASMSSGNGGGSGSYAEAVIPNPAAQYSYTVGAKGTKGGAGTSGNAGGDAGDGIVIVEEYYQ